MAESSKVAHFLAPKKTSAAASMGRIFSENVGEHQDSGRCFSLYSPRMEVLFIQFSEWSTNYTQPAKHGLTSVK